MSYDAQNSRMETAVMTEPDAGGGVSPELVREVADKVWVMLLRELKIERERRRTLPARSWRAGGNRS